jgi:2-haloacid dehalogenase
MGGVIRTVVLDIGGVLLDWNPRHLYDRLIADGAERERFLAEVCSPAWNAELDLGRSFDEACAELADRFPDQAELIHAWKRQDEMVAGVIPGMPELVQRVQAAHVPRYLLTNMAARDFRDRVERYPILRGFDGAVVSGDEGLAKPSAEIFGLLVSRFGVEPAESLFIDDTEANVRAAEAVGFRAHHFTDAASLAELLEAHGL